MDEQTKAKLDRLRAKRGGHRGVCTKLVKEAEEMIKVRNEDHITRSEVIYSSLSEKLRTLNDLGEQILELCDINDVQDEIEESSVIESRILDIIKRIEKYKLGQTNGNKVSEITTSSSEDTVVNVPVVASNGEQTSVISNNNDVSVYKSNTRGCKYNAYKSRSSE